MWLRAKNVYKCWDAFYTEWQVFKWHLRKTIIDWWREHCELYGCKSNAPKTPKRIFKEDYQAFKERRGFQDIYVVIDWCYQHEANVWQFQVVVPVYHIEDWEIKTIYVEKRWRYPLTILECTPVEHLPRDEWGTIEPNESYSDCISKYWRDSNMFVALNWHNALRKVTRDDATDRDTYASITWIGKPIVNNHNLWYRYLNWELSAVTE